ncbi:hypothetical protein E4T42_01679 [Aureobasidium subglaciale]|nr:hypothetical protein E4T42_01679 [Aureobasidium subglaciale]
MGSPKSHLPQDLSQDHVASLLASIKSPNPLSIRRLQVTAEFHIIYIISYTASDLKLWLPSKHISHLNNEETTELILRISGNHISKIKTENEVAVLSWLRDNTGIPVPAVVKFDSSTRNSLACEYMLMTREPGVSLADVYASLDATQMDGILDQLLDVNAELHKHEWSHVGGLCFDGHGNVVPGPVLEETFWFEPDIIALWPSGETFESLNISGPFASYSDYISEHLLKYKHAIEIHSSLGFMQDILPRLDRFLDVIATEPLRAKLNNVPLRLAHEDLHFANILIDPSTAKIISIIDWEFAGVVPFTRWNPSRAFLWNAQDNDSSKPEKEALMQRYEARARERGLGYLVNDAKFTSREQEGMQTVANFLRAIVEVCPRGQGEGKWKDWKEIVVRAITELGA